MLPLCSRQAEAYYVALPPDEVYGPILGGKGEVTHVIRVGTTHLMVLTPARLAATVLEGAPDAMIVVDAGGSIGLANRRATALFGYSPEEVIGLNIEHLMPERSRRRHIHPRSEYMTATRVRPMGLGLDLYGLRRDGAESPIEISSSPIEDDGEALVAAAIRDASHRKRVETELQVGGATDTPREGHGLGLEILARSAKLLDLRLEVRSQPETGSCFPVFLPPAREQLATPARRSGSSGGLRTFSERHKTLKLLLVEDDRSVRDATRRLLSVEGHLVTAVSSLAEALEAARAGVDLLVSDYHLPDGETGTQVIATLRKALRTPLKAVRVTGDTSTAVRELPRDPNLRIAGKPLQAEEMLKLLQSLMGADDPRLWMETPVLLETREYPIP